MKTWQHLFLRFILVVAVAFALDLLNVHSHIVTIGFFAVGFIFIATTPRDKKSTSTKENV